MRACLPVAVLFFALNLVFVFDLESIISPWQLSAGQGGGFRVFDCQNNDTSSPVLRRGPHMRSSRDTYGIKTLKPGQCRYIGGKTRDQFRRVLVSYCARVADVRQKVFEWSDDTGGILVRRVM